MRTTAAVLIYGALAGAALASPCGERVKALQTRYDAKPILSGDAPLGGTGAAETTGAMLHHQPTAGEVPAGSADPMSPQSLRDAKFRDAMLQATAAANSGDEPTCESSLRTAEAAYGGK